MFIHIIWASGIFLTGIIALLSFKLSVVTNASGSITGFTSLGNALFFSGLKWVVMLAPLGIVFYMSFGIKNMSAAKALEALDINIDDFSIGVNNTAKIFCA